jgi:hypothetical protein
VLMPDAKVPEAPAPIDAAARADWLAGQAAVASDSGAAGAGGEGAAAPAFETLVLTPAVLSVAERAHLVLTKPLSVHPAATVEFAADTSGTPGGAAGGMAGGMAGLRLKVRAGETYLLDFAVSALGPGVYTLAADSGQRQFDDGEGALRHLLIGLKAEADGWTSVRLQRSGAGFHLHSVEITGAP